MAADWQNPLVSLDVSNDGLLAPIDVLQGINRINSAGAGPLLETRQPDNPYYDVNGDAIHAPDDILAVINALNNGVQLPIELTEGSRLANERSLTIGLGQESGARTYRLELQTSFDTTDNQAVLEDVFNVYLLDPAIPGQTLLDQGQPGTALFSLRGNVAEYIPGQVRFDGSVLEIDLTSLADRSQGRLLFQLLSTDSDTNSRVTVRPLSNNVAADREASPMLGAPAAPATAGGILNVGALTETDDLKPLLGQVRYNTATGRFTTELRLRNDDVAVGRQVAVAFPGLPSSVVLRNPSGTTPGGDPYINFAPALRPGGLASSAISDAMLVEFDNPSGAKFTLVPVVLAGPANRAPDFPAIGAQTIMPGGVLNLTLQASDPDGDPIQFMLEGISQLPSGTLKGNGQLRIAPRPDQLGSYTFTATASDGALRSTQQIIVDVVADPLTTTRISGVILDTFSNPLVGLPVEVGGVSVNTDQDGRFLLDFGNGPLPSDTLQVHGEALVGPETYPFIAEKLTLVLEREVFDQVNNVIDRPIYLPALDLANAVPIDPAVDTMVTTAAIPGASVFVGAGTLEDQQGGLFSGLLSITEVPVNLTPAALPANLAASLVVTIQPGEMVFTQPAPLTLPNREGWPPGTLLNLYSINPVTGQFDDVGDARVSADGSLVETISGGIRNSSWHFVPPPEPEPDDPEPEDDDGCDDNCNCKGGAPAGSDVLLHSGALHEQHALPGYQSLGETRGVVLHYNSLRADVRPIVQLGFDNVPDDPDLRVVAEMSVRRGDFQLDVPGFAGGALGLDGGQHVWDVPDDGGDIDFALQVDLSSQPTGIYEVDVMTGLLRLTGGALFGSSSVRQSRLTVVNEIGSPFGAGWSIAGLTRLVENPGGMLLLVDGDGTQLQFTPPSISGQSYGNRPGDFSTLVKLPDDSYRRTMTDGTVYQFAASGRLSEITDRNGNQTLYQYDVAGNLQSITDPAGLVMTFSYSGGRVSQITDPAGRTTQLEYDAVGNLVRITDPNMAERQFQYDPEHRMVGETDALGRQETELYDFAGRIRQVIHKDGSVQRFEPVQSQALFPSERTSDPLNPPTAIRARDRVARTADENGQVIEYTLDRAGQIVSARDAVGPLPTAMRGVNNRVTQVVDARGHVALFEYDARGNLLSWRDEVSGAGSVLGQIGAPGEVDEYVFDAIAGQRLFYDAAGTHPNDVRITLRGPSGEVVVNNFAANNDFGALQLPADGEYRLQVFGTGDATGLYEFRLFSPAETESPLSTNTAIGGTIQVPGQLDVYTFSGSIGQRVFFDSLVASQGNLRVTLITPSGSRLLADNSASGNHGPFTLGEAGEYQLLIFGNGDDLGDYEFQLAESTFTSTPLNYDTPIQETIAIPGEADEFTFVGNVGDRLLIDSLGFLPGDLRLSLISPTGEVLINNHNTDNDTGVVTVDTPGIYRLVVFGTGDSTGSYDFQVATSTITVQSGSLDTPISGTITKPGEVDVYTFTPNLGDLLLYDGMGSAPGDIRVNLLAPDGEVHLNFGGSEANHGRFVVDQSGTYQLRLFGNGDNTGNYDFRLVASTPSVTPISLDTPVMGSLDEPGEVDVFTFDANPGDLLRFDALLDIGPDIRMTLTNPSGVILLNGVNADVDQPPRVLTESGTFKLSIFASGDDTGTYQFQVQDLASSPLTLGVPQSVMLDPGLSSKTFQYQGTAGQRLSFQSQQAANGSWALVGPDGRAMSNTFGLSSSFIATLPADGAYTLLVSGGNAAGIVNFQFQADDVTDAPVTPSGLGTVQSGTLNAGQQLNFTFDIPAGLPIYLDSLTTAATPIDFDLRDPFGQLILNSNDTFDRGPVVAPRSGTYTLTVRGESASSSGNFAFRLLDGSQATVLTASTATTANLAALEAQLYQIDLAVGDRLYYDALENDADDTRIGLFSPTGEYVIGVFGALNSDSDNGPLLVDEAGTYLLSVQNFNNAVSDAQFQVIRGTTTPTVLINYGDVVNGTIDTIAELDVYAFAANTGDQIFYDALQNDADDIRITLISPLGTRLIGPFGPEGTDADRGPALLEETGVWHLLLEGQGSSTGDYAFRIVESTTTIAGINYGDVVSGSIDVVGERDIYTFTGAVGQRIFYDSLQNDADDIRVSLISPGGTRLIGVFGAENSDSDRGPFQLEESGTYQLILQGNGQATGDYAFRVVESQITTTAISYDQVVTGSIDVVGELDVFSFTGAAGDRIYYDALQNDPDDVRVSLISPLGARIIGVFGAENSDSNFGPFTLTESGTFLLALHGNGQSLGDYEFRIVQSELTVSDIQIGQSIADSIDLPGAANMHRFHAEAGQTLLYDALVSNPDAVSLILDSPSDQRLIGVFGAENADNDSGLLRLTETGTYRLTVVGNVDATGSYGFRMLDTGSTELAFDTPTTVTVGGRSQSWFQFQGTAGMRFYLDDLGSSSNQGLYYLITPDRTLLTSRSLAGDLEQVLPVDGTYQLGIDAESGTPTIDVMFEIRQAAEPVTTIALNAPVAGSLSQAGDQHSITFLGAAGQRIRYDSLGTGLPALTASIVSPSGQAINQAANADGTPLVLTETGAYRVVIDGAGVQTGAYSFQLQDLTTAPLVTLGTPTTATLGPGQAAQVFGLQGTKGQRLVFDDLDGTANRGTWTLFGVGTRQLAQQTMSTDFTVTMPADGTYLLVFTSANPAVPAAIHFQVTDTGQVPTPLSGLENAFTGAIAPGQQDVFNFTAPAGTRILFDTLDPDNDPVQVEIRDPSANLVINLSASSDSGLISLPLSGTYTITVRGNSGSSTGDYDFRVLTEASDAPLVAANSLATGSLVAQEAQIHRFRGFTGQTLYLDVAADAFAGIPVQLYDPDGRLVSSTNTALGFGPFSLEASGNYLLVIGNSATPRTYGFQFLDALSAPLLDFETPVTDAVTAGKQADLYRIDGLAGQRLFFDTASGTSGASTWQLFGSNNVRLVNSNLNNDFEATLPRDGTYLLLVEGLNLVTDNYTIQVGLPDSSRFPVHPDDSNRTATGRVTYTYDPQFNQLTSVIDELGRQWIYAVDPANGNRLSETRVVGNPGGGDDVVTTFTYTPAGLLDTVTDPLGRVTDFDYDALGRRIQRTYAQGTADELTWRHEYDAAGNVSAVIDPLGQRTEYAYDPLNRLVQITQPDPDGAGPLPAPVSSFEYDLVGNVVRRTDASGHTSEFQYDLRNRLVRELQPDMNFSSASYDPAGNLLRRSDPLGQTVLYDYDPRGRLIGIHDPLGGTTQLTYDLDGNLIQVTDPLGNVTRYEFDARDRGVREIDPLGAITEFQYDPANQLERTVDRNGRITEFEYDELGYVTSELWFDGGNELHYTYDTTGNLLTATDAFSSLTFTYDNLGRVRTVDNLGTPDAPRVELTYSYDGAGNRIGLDDVVDGQAGGSSSYGYDPLSRLVSVTQTGNGLSDKRVDFSYNALGQFEQIQRFADLAATVPVASSTYAYDTLDRLTSLVHSDPGVGDIAAYTFQYDVAGRLSEMASGDGVTNYGYDAGNQLTSATNTGGAAPNEVFSYDAVGNRVSSTAHAGSYVTGVGNRLVSDGTYDYQYDATGNLIRRTEIASGDYREFAWDFRDRLVTVVDKDAANQVEQTVRNVYDVRNRRIAQEVESAGGTTGTHFAYDGHNVLIEFADPDGVAGPQSPAISQRYLHGPAVDQVLAQDDGTGGPVWLLADHLGTIRDLIDDTGAVLNHLQYDAFGNVVAQSNGSVSTRYRFTGREYDEAVDLYYYRNRYYDADMGRFLSLDPIGFAGGSLNLYSYVGNAPNQLRDPFGLQFSRAPYELWKEQPRENWPDDLPIPEPPEPDPPRQPDPPPQDDPPPQENPPPPDENPWCVNGGESGGGESGGGESGGGESGGGQGSGGSWDEPGGAAPPDSGF